MARVDAVVIAGGTISNPELRSAAGVDCKSLIPLNGKPMVQWVVEALKSAQTISSVVLIGPPALAGMQFGRLADQVLAEETHEVDNLMKAADVLTAAERILMVSSDMPLLTAEAVDEFILNAPDADVVYPAVPKEDILAQFPDRQWVFVKAREGEFTGSSAVMFRPEAFRNHQDTLRKVFDSRRSVPELVKMWGVGFALKFALGQLSISDAERHISEVLSINGRAYISRYPELAFDVDKASDIPLAEERLRGR
ncbi:MAG TPA: NTP transferase domain-containing protein [Armatimonadota bacterium]|nr:NTP transferase domain-containing protein [Armatimonadota bacterium]